MEGTKRPLFAFSCVLLAVVYAGSVRAHPAAPMANAEVVRAPYEPCPIGAPCVIMPLGDSITAGAGSSDEAGYRGPLFARAHAEGHAITLVGSETHGPPEVAGAAFPRTHEGHGGFTIDPTPTRAGIAPLVAGAVTRHAPHIVLLMIGTNDITDGTESMPARLAALLDAIIAVRPSALVVLAQLMPNASTARDEATRAFNAALPDIVATRVRAGAHITLVDMHTPFVAQTPRTALFADEVHPNDAGYAVIADVFYAAIARVLR